MRNATAWKSKVLRSQQLHFNARLVVQLYIANHEQKPVRSGMLEMPCEQRGKVG